MRFSLLTLLLIAALTGCAKKDEAHYADSAPAPALAMAMGEQAKRMDTPDASKPYLAYEHTVDFYTSFDKVEELHNTALKACSEAAAEECVVLNTQITKHDYYAAQLRFRAKAAGIQKILKALGDQGKIVRQATSAEDLSGPITDSEKRLAILRDYRNKLEALRNKAGNDIESLIKVNEQLAQTQGEIEALSGQSAYMQQRVDTEILNIQISAENKNGFWYPISKSFSDFGAHLSQGVSAAITAIAYLIPWSLFLCLLLWVLRLLWRKLRKPKQ